MDRSLSLSVENRIKSWTYEPIYIANKSQNKATSILPSTLTVMMSGVDHSDRCILLDASVGRQLIRAILHARRLLDRVLQIVLSDHIACRLV